MNYKAGEAGRVANHPSGHPSDPSASDFWTFEAVQERLVDALRCWWRWPDADRRFGLAGKISSLWQQAVDDPLALIERAGRETEAPRPLPLSRGDMQRTQEATEWLLMVPERDRRLVCLALTKLAAGHSQVPWLKVKHQFGLEYGAEGLRKRYGRALTQICNNLNSAENRHNGASR
jgi:hypothetical protein